MNCAHSSEYLDSRLKEVNYRKLRPIINSLHEGNADTADCVVIDEPIMAHET